MDEESPPPASKPSQVPSWLTLGFVLGALFVLALPRKGGVEPQPAPAPAAARPERPAAPPRISTIEAVFEEWGRYAVWSDGTTEVALWNPETKSFSDCFEVGRAGDAYYFRTITSLTRPILSHGVADESPLQFTETARQRQEWLDAVSRENQKAFIEGVHQSFGPPDTDAAKK
jgi:hypothetical protein